ncbi:MAG: two component, sigma54 specific, transcriptional regulator, Fis family [Phycisphaerales bacterium]|nr:two component, sigma54 specific, transcriptional regulator, Fis family [Phycisphaerales bacterium]MDB5355207.1 two component, sigma54 specific, transcriptional regulator, Fis family [Phycisphaerales bacterium]
MVPAAKSADSKTVLPPRVLIVDDEPALRELVEELVTDGVNCRVLTASNIAEARKILATSSVQLLITDVNLPDGDGTSLLPILQRHQPTASAIVITGAPSLDRAINAMREGALDFLPKPFTHAQLVDRTRKALDRQARLDKQERRFARLKVAVKRLNESRRTISRKVDLLCNDLITAYGDLSKQLDGVRTQEGFRKFIENAKDLEQLLCHAMDWMLRQLGYANVAVFLAGEDGEFQLGAYMKYTIAGDAPVTDAIKRVLLPPTSREGLLHLPAKDFQGQFTPAELTMLKTQDVLGVNCTYLGESLAAILFFRDQRSAFTADDESLLKAISPIFAVALASVVRDSRPADDDPHFSNGDDTTQDPDRGPRRDPADWWKQGGESPY